MYFTPDRLLLIAVVVTLISADGFYRARRQRGENLIGHRLYVAYAAVLGAGTVMVWVGFLAALSW